MRIIFFIFVFFPNFSMSEDYLNMSEWWELNPSETHTKVISADDFGLLECEYLEQKDINSSYYTRYILCQFQNIKYEYVTDLGVVLWWSQDAVDKTISGLNKCFNYMNDKGYEMKCDDNFYLLQGSESVHVMDKDKHSFLNDRNITDLINWLKNTSLK